MAIKKGKNKSTAISNQRDDTERSVKAFILRITATRVAIQRIPPTIFEVFE